MAAIERVVTHGTFELEGGSWEVDNNIWVVADDSGVVILDATHTGAPIVAGSAGAR